MNKLSKIEEAIQNCNSCENLIKLNCDTISYGKNTDILFIGESPAKNGMIIYERNTDHCCHNPSSYEVLYVDTIKISPCLDCC